MRAPAPAKLNLYLHILGDRADGYHELETLVVFTELADIVEAGPAETLSLAVKGPFAHLAGNIDDNLVLRAARALDANKGAAITLTKNIPAGAGLGGGSADAAAALKLLNELWALELPPAELARIAATLGADIAMCLASRPTIARGIGDRLTSLASSLPPLAVLLVYPNKPLPTAKVYGAFTQETAPPPPDLARMASVKECFMALGGTRNQLQRTAITLMPEIAEVLLALGTLSQRPELTRMTGSGSACFALFADPEKANGAAEDIRARHPEWWVEVTRLIA